MSLHAETKALVNRVIQQATKTAGGPPPAPNSEEAERQAGLATDFLLLENEILVFQSGNMSPEAMTTLKSDLEEMVRKYHIA